MIGRASGKANDKLFKHKRLFLFGMIIGLTGTMGAGKGEIAELLKDKGYEYYVFSDVVKEEAKKRGLNLTRENLQNVGNLLREEYEQGILAKMLIARFKSGKVVVDGVRNSDEIRELRKNGNFVLIGIDAPQRLRFERLKKRARPGDPTRFEEFKRMDDKENKSVGRGQEINKCLKMADYRIINDGSLDRLKDQVEEILSDF